MKIVSIGHNNFIPCEKIEMILQRDSRPIRNKISAARDQEKLIDATNGKKTKSVIITSDGFVILSAIAPKTLAERCENKYAEESISD